MSAEDLNGKCHYAIHKSGIPVAGVEKTFEAESPFPKTKMLWHDDYYYGTPDGKRVMALAQGSVVQPEILTPYLYQDSATAARVISIAWVDSGGSCYINLKGLQPNLQSSTAEVEEHLRWEIFNRRGNFNDIAGKEVYSQADQEVSTFVRLCESHPELKYDLNAPFWRPLAVISTGNLIITRDTWPVDKGNCSIEQSVVTVRRQPYTLHRLDEYVEHRILPSPSLEGISKLRRLWGMESDDLVFLRGVNRWGQASRLLYEAQIVHNQTFLIVRYKGAGAAAWMNFNNIAIDGSTGDLDMGQVIPKNDSNEWVQLRDSLGGAAMYLMLVQRLRPDFVADDSFMVNFFRWWRRGISDEMFMNMTSWTSYNSLGPRIFDQVVTGIEKLAKWYSSCADTKPSTNLNTSAFLQHSTKGTWSPVAMKVALRMRQLRPSLGI